MGVIWTSRTRTKQPTGAVRVNSRYGRVLHWQSGDESGDVRSAVPGTSAQNVKATSKGLGLSSEAAVKGSRFGASDSIGSGSITLIALISINGAAPSGATTGIFGNWSNTTTSRSLQITMPGTTTAVRFQVNRASTGLLDSGSLSTNTPHILIGRSHEAGEMDWWVNGALMGSASGVTGDLTETGQYWQVGSYYSNDYDRTSNVTTIFSVALGRYLLEGEVKELSANPWQLFAPERRPVFFSLPSGANNTATLSSTLDATTLTGVGAVTRSGTLAVTLDAATLAGIGGVATSGTLAVTLDAATLTGVGAVTTSGTLAVTLDAATLAGVGSVAVGSNRDGTLAVTLDAATLAGIGAVTTSGTLAVTLDAATLAGMGTAGQAVTGTLGVTLGNATLAGIGAIPAAPSAGGGKTFGSNKKKKKQRKAIESEEWLKAEETAKQLLQDRFTKTTPEAKLEALASHIESLQPVIEALKALAREDVQEAVQETRTEELTEHQLVLNRFDALEKKIESVEELLIILMADL